LREKKIYDQLVIQCDGSRCKTLKSLMDVYVISSSGFVGFLVDKGINYSTKEKTLQLTKD
jgi:hypothetical protein